ncbi:MAG TPA: GIY-YIG nuclease family protein [Phycisphaerales bacterium]|nr:GIY-YIG nuclease family protein [Phycisphaerales bacterium]
MAKTYYVYMLTNKTNRVLYTGVTSDLRRRLFQHKEKKMAGFTSSYNATKLVHYETFGDANAAINREKQIKNWRRVKKNELIEQRNGGWEDVSGELFVS